MKMPLTSLNPDLSVELRDALMGTVLAGNQDAAAPGGRPPPIGGI